MDEYYNQKAMEIILHAGDGRMNVMSALDLIAEKKYKEANEMLKKAYEEIQEGHRVQTSVLQSIASGEVRQEYSVLFSHAQDTIMTVYSEYNITNKILKIIKEI